MAGRSYSSLLLQIVLMSACMSLALSGLPEDKVSVRFDEIYSIDDWTDENQEKFLSAVNMTLNNNCSADPASCGMDPYSLLTVNEDKIEYFNGDIKVTIYVTYGDDFLTKDTLTTVLSDPYAIQAMEDATGKTVGYVGEDRITPVDYSLDIIMIPVVIVLFLIVCLLALILVCRESHTNKKKQEAMALTGNKKGEEAVTLTAVKTTSDDSGDNNATNANAPKSDDVAGVHVALTA